MGSFSALHWVIALVMLAIAAVFFRGVWRMVFPGKGASLVCITCGHHGPTKPQTRGSFAIELVLWLLFIVPGLLYSLWRLSTRRHVCSACGGATLVPPDTPAGRKLLQDAAQ